MLIAIAVMLAMFGLAFWFDAAVKKGAAELTQLLDALQADPTNRGLHRRIVELLGTRLLVGQKNLKGAGIETGSVYERALVLMEAHATDPGLRELALGVARWHYASAREDLNLTLVDEQAIQNDLLMRCVPTVKNDGHARPLLHSRN
jgi:hypothetical protein